MAFLVDTNILVYRFDRYSPHKRAIATELLRQGIADESACVPHQAIVEFVSVVTRLHPDRPALLSPHEAFTEAEGIVDQFQILYPKLPLVRTALRGAALYQLPWYDAHLWAYAEHYGIPEIMSEDFTHGRRYGTVKIVNPPSSTNDQLSCWGDPHAVIPSEARNLLFSNEDVRSEADASLCSA